MAEELTLERRIEAVEREVAELRRRLEGTAEPGWLRKVAGSVSDGEALREASEYGRAIRQADRPADDQ